MSNYAAGCLGAVILVLFWLALWAGFGAGLQFLYNACLAEPYGWQPVGFWQTVGIIALLTIIGGFFKRSKA